MFFNLCGPIKSNGPTLKIEIRNLLRDSFEFNLRLLLDIIPKEAVP